MSVARTLLSHCIDYAGLFPPAGLDLATTIENYAGYKAGPKAWALGRLILPADKLVEFAAQWPRFAAEWPLTLLLRNDIEREWRVAESAGVPVETVECRPVPVEQVPEVARIFPASSSVYIEVGSATEPAASMAAIAHAGARAKVRTGGVQPEAFPSPAELARFIACCMQHGVPFKATAGLHHAVRGTYALTYEQGSAKATMHGFLNVLLTTALLADVGNVQSATALLEETSLTSFHFDEERVRWRDWTVTHQQLAHMRQHVMAGFGSCSFTEPLQEIRAGGLLL